MNITRFMETPAELIRRFHFIAGHFDTWYLRKFKTNPYVISVLREPIDRFVSEYYYWKDPQNIDDDPRKPKNMPNISLESFAVNPMFGNIQVKSLSDGLISPNSSSLNHEKVLSNALATLQNMTWFGIAEFSNQSTDMLTYMYGWRPTNFDQKVNTNNKRLPLSQIDQKLITSIELNNDLDIRLFENAKIIFREKYLAFLLLLLGLKTTLEIKNYPYSEVRTLIEPKLWERYYSETSSLPRVKKLLYTFDNPLSGEYWMRGDGKQTKEGFMWRWTTGENATIDLSICREAPLEVRFHVKYILGNNLKLLVDDRCEIPIKGEKQRNNNMGTIYRGVMPPNWNWRKKLTTLTFHCENLKKPEPTDYQLTDTRPLGVAIDWIEILPVKTEL